MIVYVAFNISSFQDMNAFYLFLYFAFLLVDPFITYVLV